MIAKTQAYAASDGSLHAKLEEAQMVSLAALFRSAESGLSQHAVTVATIILDQREQVLDILTTTSKSRPKRRLVNGYPGHRKGKAKPASAIAGEAASAA